MNRAAYIIERPVRSTLTDRIAAALTPELLALRTRRLARDIVTVYGVSIWTAQHAVAQARRAMR